MLIISVENIVLDAYVGVFEIEKKEANTYLVDVYVETAFSESFLSDRIEDTLNYASIYEIVLEDMSISCNLLEHKAFSIVRTIFERFEQAKSIRIKIRKSKPLYMPLCSYSGVELSLKRADIVGS